MTPHEELLWWLKENALQLNDVRFKLDGLARRLTRDALISPTYGPTGPTAPTSTAPGGPKLRELGRELLWPACKKLAAWCGEKLATYGLSHLLPPLLGIWLLGREGWSRLLAWIGWLLP